MIGTMNIGRKTTRMTKVIENLDIKNNCNGSIYAFSTLRGLNGDAADNYSCFNVCDYTGDTPQHVAKCRHELCQLLSIEPSHLIMPRQTHTDRVAIVDDTLIATDDAMRSSLLQDIDALVTAVPNVAIGVNTADCVPIIFCDPSTGILGAAHAGWKGTVMRIGARTVEAMIALGAHADDIEAVIGPSICPQCFEVGDEVVKQFIDNNHSHSIIHRNFSTGKAHIDLWKANYLTLVEAGIAPENISISGNCTRCNPSHYFSARRIGIKSGRIFTGIIRKV